MFFFKKKIKGRFERVNLPNAIVLSTLQVNSLAVMYLGYFYLTFLIWGFYFIFKKPFIGIFEGGLERVKLCKFVSISSSLYIYIYVLIAIEFRIRCNWDIEFFLGLHFCTHL
jgi:hypothetical protein